MYQPASATLLVICRCNCAALSFDHTALYCSVLDKSLVSLISIEWILDDATDNYSSNFMAFKQTII